MSLLIREKFDYLDRAVLYVTTCSDVDDSFKDSRRFLECRILGVTPKFSGKDSRYRVCCAEALRKEAYKNGLRMDEAMVGENSPFLMTREFFNKLKDDSELREQWLKEIEELILGKNIPEELGYWQEEVSMIIKELDTDAHDVISDIKSDFAADKMEMICF